MGNKGINVENVWETNKGKPYITTAIIDFVITSSTDNIETFKAKPDKPVE